MVHPNKKFVNTFPAEANFSNGEELIENTERFVLNSIRVNAFVKCKDIEVPACNGYVNSVAEAGRLIIFRTLPFSKGSHRGICKK